MTGATVPEPVVLVVHWVLAECSAGVTHSERVLGEHSARVERNQPSVLPRAVNAALASASKAPAELDLIVVVVAPGGFTALRSVVAYAHGLGLSLGIPIVGITAGEAFRHALGRPGGREVWCCWKDRLGRILLDRLGVVTVIAPEDLPLPEGPVAIVGEAAPEVAAWLAAQGADVQLTGWRVPSLSEIAAAGQILGPNRPDRGGVGPLYSEPPAVRSSLLEDRASPIP